jgi:hypothetical protein
LKKKKGAVIRKSIRGKIRHHCAAKIPENSTLATFQSIEDLICGLPVSNSQYIDSDYCGLVDRLRSDLSDLHPQLQAVVGADTGLPASAVFPFLARKFLELSLTGLLSRIDPIRVIAARKNQRDTSFEAGRQNPSSVTWTGDLFPSEKPPTGGIWESQILKKGVERSALGWHFGDVAFSPGLRWLTDIDTDNSTSEWLRELGSQEKPFDWIKGHLTQLYSALSKGVHAEYLLDDGTAFDKASIQQYMQDCYKLVLLLATATHISPLFFRSLPPATALLVLRKLEIQLATKDS